MNKDLEPEYMFYQNPWDMDYWPVYGDWLSSRDDARGQVLALELARRADFSNAKVKIDLLKLKESDVRLEVFHRELLVNTKPEQEHMNLLGNIDAVFRKHKYIFLGGLLRAADLAQVSILKDYSGPRTVKTPRLYRGERAALLNANGRALDLEWLGGYIRKAVLHINNTLYTPTIDGFLKELLFHPSAKLLHKLTIRAGGFAVSAPLASILAEGPEIRALRRLCIYKASIGNIYAFAEKYPDLQGMILEGWDLELAELDFPQLTYLRVKLDGFGDVSAQALVDAKLPKLETLSLQFQRDISLNNVERMANMLQNPAFRNLKHLALRRNKFIDVLIPVLVESPLTIGLESLVLTDGMTDKGALLLCEYAEYFPELSRIDLGGNRISTQIERKLTKAFGRSVHIVFTR